MSLGLILGGIGFFIERDWQNYGRNFKRNRAFLFVLGFYFLHLVGLIWSRDLDFGLHDVKVKFSLLGVGLIIASRPPLSELSKWWLVVVLVLSLAITSTINFVTYSFFREQLNFTDARDMSLFGSHIRYGILIAFGPLLAFWLYRRYQLKFWVFGLFSLWMLFYTYYSQVLSGVVSVLVVIAATAIFWVLSAKKWWLLFGMGTPILLTVGGLLYYLSQPIPYLKNANLTLTEEQRNELSTAWNQVSDIPFSEKDEREQWIEFTVQRYLISKNLPVNKKGISQLSNSDIRNIEKGFADINEIGDGMLPRLFGLRFQLHHANNPNGHTVLERLEYWKTAWKIIQRNYLIGVGTGDVLQEMQAMYDEENSPLLEENRLRAHNSYLTFWLTFGIFGLLFFIALNLNFIHQQWKKRQLLGFVFGTVMLVTFSFEDTLETQMGVTLFAFFYFLFQNDFNFLPRYVKTAH